VVVISGKTQILWNTLRQALFVVKSLPASCATHWLQADMMAVCGFKWDTVDSFPNVRKGEAVSVFELLTANKGKGAADTRDMVFALLGLSTDGRSDSFQPDYSKSVRQVYKETVKDVISREDNLAFLACAGGPKNKTEFPTWVVD
jgi:hypothetical protein